MTHHFNRPAGRLLLGIALLSTIAGCGARNDKIPADPAQADRFLFERGTDALKRKKWLDAREYFRQIVENYPQSTVRADAKLGVADSYLGEGSTQSLVLGANEYREFLTFYPTNQRADYAQYKLAMTYFEQMHAPDRDQTPTKEALQEFATFFERFPDSPLMPEVRAQWRIARDRLSEYSYRVAVGYYNRNRYCPPVLSRLNEIRKEDPEFSNMAGVYYYLAECLARADRKQEAIPLLDRVVTEHKTSEHFERAQKRLKELQAQ
jgi:outer membrane protein assembly factor BamD